MMLRGEHICLCLTEADLLNVSAPVPMLTHFFWTFVVDCLRMTFCT